MTNDRGVVTAADARMFPCAALLAWAMREQDVALAIVDAGLAADQRDWLERGGVRVVPMPRLPPSVASGFTGWDKRPAFWKPWYFDAVPWRNVLWLDADALPILPLDEAFDALADGPLLTKDCCPEMTAIRPDLVAVLRGRPGAATCPPANSGVVGLRRPRDAALLQLWQWGVQQCAERREVEEENRFWDQGLLNYALDALRLHHSVRQDTRFNCPGRKRPFDFQGCGLADLLPRLRELHPNMAIIHWMGDGKLPEAAPQCLAELLRAAPNAPTVAGNVEPPTTAEPEPAVVIPATPARRPIRVALWQPLEYGGLERWTISLAENLDPARVELVGLALATEHWTDPDIRAAVARRCRIVERVEDLPPCDVLLFSCVKDAGARLPPDWNTPTVLIAHGVCDWTKAWVRSSAAAATHLVGVSEHAAAKLAEWTGRHAECIPNGVDLHRAAPRAPREELRRRWGVPEDAHCIAYCGRFFGYKGIAAVAGAVGCLANGYGLFAGWGLEEWRIWQAAGEWDAGHRIRVVPAVTNVGEILGAADVFCSPAEYEGFGLAVVEAMAARVPVVATLTGVLPEAEARRGQLFVRVPFNAPAADLAAACVEAASPGNRVVVERACRVARAEYLASRMAAAWTNFLSTEIKEAPR